MSLPVYGQYIVIKNVPPQEINITASPQIIAVSENISSGDNESDNDEDNEMS